MPLGTCSLLHSTRLSHLVVTVPLTSWDIRLQTLKPPTIPGFFHVACHYLITDYHAFFIVFEGKFGIIFVLLMRTRSEETSFGLVRVESFVQAVYLSIKIAAAAKGKLRTKVHQHQRLQDSVYTYNSSLTTYSSDNLLY